MSTSSIRIARALLAAGLLALPGAAWAQGATAQTPKPAEGISVAPLQGATKPVEEHMNPEGNKPVEEHMSPGGVKDLEKVMRPSTTSPDEHANARAVKSLEEVTRPDATVDVNELTVPSGEPEPSEDTETEE